MFRYTNVCGTHNDIIEVAPWAFKLIGMVGVGRPAELLFIEILHPEMGGGFFLGRESSEFPAADNIDDHHQAKDGGDKITEQANYRVAEN